MTGNSSLELMDDTAEDMHARRKKQKVNPNDEKGTNLETDSVGVQSAGGDEINTAKKSSGKQSRKSKGEHLQSGGAGKRQKGSKESNARRRPKGQERTLSVEKERKRKNSYSRSNETSSTDRTNSDEEQETEIEKLEVSQIRRVSSTLAHYVQILILYELFGVLSYIYILFFCNQHIFWVCILYPLFFKTLFSLFPSQMFVTLEIFF